MISVGFLGAFLGGALALLSPCSALLLPAFFAYAFSSKTNLAARTLVFFAGLSCVLVSIGFGAGNIGGKLAEHRGMLISIGGWVTIALGVCIILGFGFTIPGFDTLMSKVRGTSWLSVFLLGAVYGFAGFCAGPLLGAVLTTAVVGGSPTYGAAVMAFYAFGMTLPLFLLALVWDRLNVSSWAWLRGRSINIIAGLLFIAIGVLFLTTHGTSALPSLLSTEAQFNIQNWVARWSGRYTNAQVLLGVAVIVELMLLVRLLWLGRRGAGAAGSGGPGSSDSGSGADASAGETEKVAVF